MFHQHCTRWLARIERLAAAGRTKARLVVVAALRALRHPTRRGIALALGAVPAAFLLYVLALVPFTPGIGDIRKVRVDRPASILSADGKLLADFKPVNREWVSLKQISPYMVDALVATEDRRFY